MISRFGKKRIRVLIMTIVVGVFVVPVAITPFTGADTRVFDGVRLADVSFREASFRNAAHEIDLAGMLFVPQGDGPFPAAVIIHGSGTSRRDSFWYLTMTRYLQDNGILVLLPDKRGSERSGGDWRTASLEDLATDTRSAITYLKGQTEVGVSHIGVVGLSQGGHIAPIVASQSPDVVFVVNIVGGAVPMHELLVYEEDHNLRDLGVLPGISRALAYGTSLLIREVRQREFWDAVGNFDPIPYWERVNVKSLVLYGERDTNVPSGRSAERLRSLGKANVTIKVYERSGHALEDPPGTGNNIFREDALRDIRDFIHSSIAIGSTGQDE